MLTHNKLLKAINYNKDTGIFTRHNGKLAGSNILNSCGNYYCEISINGKSYLAHRLAVFYVTGSWPNGHIDHIRGNTLDNRFKMLRVVDNQENSLNRKIQANNTTGCSGVTTTKNGKFKARINFKNREISLGTHDKFETAVTIRKAAECWYGFHKNNGRSFVNA